ncbi:AAA family ATPase [Gorillibacterium sp. sgz500922]|uniref:AAA family ATPase n=1 Tax=Gorillibacterium sp. sgz500922 TaxID=3446694 RepID=UPI003F680F44
MKPIHLSLSGLQSYRQKQEVDFRELNGSGVFGIFGPTGSGKSTILDAITLALFGEVERAVKGTQGIMNHAETVLAVSFTFELTKKQGAERYRVERQFKRGDEVSLSSSVCRLIRYRDDEQVVIADKHKDVNAKVQEVLGLSMADFTRAVVLPQGKFAEFLALKGKERREMLQRLFHLEAYGEQLGRRLASRLSQARQERERILAEQQGLGEASAEAVEAARLRLADAEAAEKDCRRARQEAEKLFEELRQLREWQQEAERYEREAAELDGQREAWQERADRLERSAQAALLVPLLDALETAERREAECAAGRTRLEEERVRAAAGHEAARLGYEEARREWAAEDAPLQVLLEQLGQALAQEREMKALAERERELRARLTELERRCAEDQARLEAERGKQVRAAALQTELRGQLAAAETPPDERERLRRAERAAQELTAANARAAELAAQAEAAAAASARLRAAAADDAARRADAAAGLAAASARGRELAAALEAAGSRLAGLGAEATAAAEADRRANAARERQRLAAELAHALTPGEPCPVCGSLEHPAPAGAEEEAPEDGAAELDRLAADCREREYAARQARLELDALLRRLADAAAVAAEAAAGGSRTAAAAAPRSAPAAFATAAEPFAAAEAASAGDSTAAAATIAAQADAACTGLVACERELRGLAAEAEPLLAEAGELARRQAELAARLAAGEEAAAAEALRHEAARAQAAALSAAWAEAFGGRSPEELAAEWAALAEKDRTAGTLRDRLRNSEPVMETLASGIARLQQELEEQGRQTVRLETEGEALRRQLEEMRSRRKERVGESDEPLEERMARAQNRLDTLRRREETARQTLEREAASLEAAGQRAAAARQAFDSAAAALADSRERWEAARTGTPFASAEQVRLARLDAETEAQWKLGLQTYRERSALLRERQAELSRKRQGRTVSDEEWRQAEERLASARAEDEAALERRARAERDREDVEAKHLQWQRLAERNGELQIDLDRMAKLQAALRGNAFIDFVAKEQLLQVTRAASDRLSELTRRRYAIEVDSEGGFVIRDDANGGIRRPVGTLSGGETFLTSLSLALALSAQIQLTGESPLEFFFLDEGFGTLDPDLLDTVVGALEQLQLDNLTVGVISHVPELRARLPKRLIVEPAEPAGGGSRITLETL